MHEQLRDKLLRWWAAVVCRRPRLTIAIAAALAGLAVVITATSLRFLPDRNALISDKLEWNQRFIEFRKHFSTDDLYVVVQTGDEKADRTRAERFVNTLARQLAGQSEFFEVVNYGFQREDYPSLLRLAPAEEFPGHVEQLLRARVMLQADNFSSFLAAMQAEMFARRQQMDAHADAVEYVSRISALMQRINASLNGESIDGPLFEPLRELGSGTGWQYLEAAEGHLLLIIIRPRLSADGLEPVAPALGALRRTMARITDRFPEVQAGITGVPVIESDETDAALTDATKASLIAIVLIALVMIAAFHGWQMPLLVLVSLAVAVAWTFGFVTLAVGHLQILSVVFTVILLGLGVAFGIHIISRFELIRPRFGSGPKGFAHAMADTMQTMGPGVATGAVTTAAAFGATAFSSFRGMAEMGLIAAVGIMLCLLAMVSVLPALMRVARTRRRHIKPVHERPISFFNPRWWQPLVDRPVLPLIMVGLAVGASILVLVKPAWLYAPGLRYDYNLSNLLPRGVESVYWMNVLEGGDGQGNGGQSIWFGASVVEKGDMNEARRLTRAFQSLDSVDSVGGVGVLFPRDEQLKLAELSRTRQRLANVLEPPANRQPDSPGALGQQVQSMALALGMGMMWLGPEHADLRQSLGGLAGQLDAIRRTLEQLPPGVAARRVAELDSAFVALQADVRRAVGQATADRPLTVEDMPEALRLSALGGPDNQRLLIQVNPQGDMYDPAELSRFVDDLRAVDPQLTGPVVQIYESNAMITSAFQWAGIVAVSAVFILLLIDFQSLTDALLALLPVAVAFLLVLGLLGATDVPLNPANIIVLPLLFGIGVDCGVHMLHRYRQAPEEHPPGLAAGTGKAITLTSLTTIIGFGSLLIARHRGVASLGFVLAMGMALTLITCLMVMPAILEIRTKLRHRWRAAAIR